MSKGNVKMWKCGNMKICKYENGLGVCRVPRVVAPLVASIISYFNISTFAYSATLSFDGNDPAPAKSEKVTVVKGISGNAAHFGKNSFLEYPASLSGFMTPTAGTIMAWFRYDNTFPSSSNYRDRDISENWKLQWIPNSGFFHRMLFASGGNYVGVGISIDGQVATSRAEYYVGRRILGGEWHFMAVSYDCSKKEVVWSLDGVVMKRDKLPDGYKAQFANTFTIGSGKGKPGLEGAIDEVTILPVAVGEEEMKDAFLKVHPFRYELLDWSVGEGETKKLRFRARNECAVKVDKEIKFSNGTVVSLSLAPNELKEFTVDVKGGKPGLFTLWINEGEIDARQFECICLGKEPRNTLNTRNNKTLIGEYDCTKEYPLDRVAMCASEVVTNGNLVYRESREEGWATPLALYRFKIRHKGKPHMVEVDYPDDRVRTFIAAVYPENWGRLYVGTGDSMGFITGVDYPLSMEMQSKGFVFWPDSDAVAVLLQNYKNAKPLGGEYSAAAAAVRIYEMEALPPGPVQGASPKTRSVATWDEDPTMDSDLLAAQSWNRKRADLDFWRIKWQRIIDYMRWNSMDSWVIKVAAYYGDSTGMYATIPEAALPWDTFETSSGRCRGWSELGADMLCRAGMGFWVHINHRDWDGHRWFSRLGGADESAKVLLVDRYGKNTEIPNILRPEVRTAYLRLVAAYRDKFAAYPGFRGFAMNEHLPPTFGSIDYGYDDFTIDAFCRETGMDVPAADANGRYEYLTSDPKRKAKWVEWRCRKTEEFAKELGAAIREKGGNAEVQIWISSMHYSQNGNLKLEKWDADAVFREGGVDAAALSRIPGIRVVPSLRPDYSRIRGTLSDEPYFPDSPSWVGLVRNCGLDCVNVFRHSNLEMWFSRMGGATRAFSKGIWLPAAGNVAFADNFSSFATPHPPPPYTLDSVASLIADADVQDFLTGWWGFMECGEHDEWCRFYGQFRQIPRGRYALAKGTDDPVAVRSGTEGHYLVNREPYPVKMEYVVDGKPETIILRQHEIRFVKGRGANGAVEVKWAKIPTAEKATHLANLEKLEAAAKADANNATLVRAAKEARAAFDEGRFHQFRALFHLGEVRKLMNPELY